MTVRNRGPIFERLNQQFKSLNYKPAFLDAAIPNWWTAEAETDPNGLDHLKLLLARTLGLDATELLKNGRVKPVAPTGMRFKRSSNLHDEEPANPNLAYFGSIVKSIAATIEPSLAIPTDPLDMHNAIRQTAGTNIVTLSSLIEYCWSRNVAVVHVDKFPLAKRGLDALVYSLNDRFVVILAREIGAELSSRASFILAHELAHIAKGHVAGNSGLIDDPSVSERRLAEEQSADAFANIVLGGGRYRPKWSGNTKRADSLAEKAEMLAAEWDIDPGHILLRFGFEKKLWPNATAAMRYLDPLPLPTAHFINGIALRKIDTSRVGGDAQALIEYALATA